MYDVRSTSPGLGKLRDSDMDPLAMGICRPFRRSPCSGSMSLSSSEASKRPWTPLMMPSRSSDQAVLDCLSLILEDSARVLVSNSSSIGSAW
jgi:hypothetical protein